MNTNNLQVGFDPTGYTSISGAQLAQLVNSSTTSSDRGMILITTDSAGVPVIPDASTTTEWQRFLWLRLSPLTTSFIVCAWNPDQTYNMGYSNSSGTTVSTNWNPISSGAIPSGSIKGYQIANATITADKLAGGIALSQIAGSSSLLTTSTTPTAGDISGSFAAGFTIGNNAVTSTKLASDAAVDANRAVTTNSIKTGAVTPVKLSPSGTAQTFMTDIAGTTPAWTVLPSIIKSTSAVTTTGNVGKIPRVLTSAASDGGTWEMVNSTSTGKVLQVVHAPSTATPAQPASAIASATTTPNYNGNGMRAFFDSGAFTKIDTTGTSKLLIQVTAVVGAANTTNVFVGLFNATGATVPLAGTAGVTAGASVNTYNLTYITAANPANATYYVAFGSTTASYTFGNSAAGTNLFSICQSSITITEFIP